MGNIEAIEERLVVGRIYAVHGVRGWVKVLSYTARPEIIFCYQPWLIETNDAVQSIKVDAWKPHGNGLVAHLQGVNDRDVAREWCDRDIKITSTKLPKLSEKEFYWHQLQNLVVYSQFNRCEKRLGVVASLLETGANDVLVVRGDSESIDTKERLIPYSDAHVKKVDLGAQRVDVDWDPDF